MRKLLSLVLSVSILVSSITPALGQVGPAGRAVVKGLRREIVTLADKKALSARVSAQVNRQAAQASLIPNVLQNRILTGNVTGLASQILQKPVALRAPILRNEFVTLSLMPGAVTAAQRAQAVKAYQTQLKQAGKTLTLSQPDLASFLTYARQHPLNADVTAVQDVLADASALGLVGTQENAPVLLDFYKQAQGTVFENTAALITARGLLRMQAYGELGTFLKANSEKENLAGVAAYIAKKGLPVEVPSSLQVSTPKAADEKLAAFLSKDFMPNRIHADPSLLATEQWMGLKVPRPQAQPVAREAKSVKNTEHTAPATENPTVEKTVVPAVEENAPLQEVSAVQEQLAVQPVAVQEAPTAKWMSSIQKIFRRNEEFDRKTFPVEIMDVAGNTKSLPIAFSLGRSIPSAEYDHVVFHEDPNFENKYIIELHDHGKEPIQMNHFYMALYNNDVGPLVKAAQKAGVNLRLKLEHTADVNYETISKKVYDEKTKKVLPLEVSVQLGQSLWAREISQGFSHWLESVGLPASYAQHALANAKIFLRANGELGMQLEGSKEILPLPREYYVRLPKHQVQNVVALLPQIEEGQFFNIVLSPTANRVDIVARDASLTSVSVGKTMGSVVHNSLGISEAAAKGLMMVTSYVVPGFASLMTPVLKKYGEKNLLTLSLGLSVLAGTLATLGGFNGFVEGTSLNLMQKMLFVGALFSLSGAGIIKQLVSNMLIRANRGEVVLSSKTEEAKQAITQTEPDVEGRALLSKRFKEFFTKKTGSLRDVVLYNKSFIYKNIGALTFLASPFLLKYGTLWLTGINLGIDYSISFPLYIGYSSYVMWKVLRSKLRDAYTAKNLLQSQQILSNMLQKGSQILAQEGFMSMSATDGARALTEKNINKTVIDDVARSFKDSLDALAFAHIKVNPSQEKKQFYQEAKEHILADLETNLVQKYAMPAEQAKQLVKQVAASIKMQENNLGNMVKMLKAPGVGALTMAMTLATVHEFVLSTSFASTIKDLISQGELANFLMSTSLYVPLIIGRLGGNWISQRIKPDTMYLLCSTLSAIGTGIMAFAGASVPVAITGAAIASLGIGNFFTQMYDYIMNRYPKHNRELSAILSLTMGIAGIAAIPAGYMTSQVTGAPLDLWYAGAALVGSLLLTSAMMKNSSLVKGVSQIAKQQWKNVKTSVTKYFNRGGNVPPAAEVPAD